MRALIGLSVSALCLAACATLPGTAQTPYLPAGVYGVYQDNDTGAITQSAWAFASPANTRNNPVEAIKAIVALEYLSGELKASPRWITVDASISYRLGEARDRLRQIVGIKPDVPSQVVVNTLLALSLDLQTGNQPAAMQVLTSPIFAGAPTRTLGTLTNLPYVQDANLATTRAEEQTLSASGMRG